MAILTDTNILVRLANKSDALFQVAFNAVAKLHRRGETLHITPQNLIEFRHVATRPTAANGLGLSVTTTEQQAADFETKFPLLPDSADIYPAWKSLVQAVPIIGKKVHDARLVAVCHAHGISHLMTFNLADFAPMSSFGPGVTIVDPGTV